MIPNDLYNVWHDDEFSTYLSDQSLDDSLDESLDDSLGESLDDSLANSLDGSLDNSLVESKHEYKYGYLDEPKIVADSIIINSTEKFKNNHKKINLKKMFIISTITFLVSLATIITLDQLFFRHIYIKLNGTNKIPISSYHLFIYFLVSLLDYIVTPLMKSLCRPLIDKIFVKNFNSDERFDKMVTFTFGFIIGTIKNILLLGLIVAGKIKLNEYENLNRMYESITITGICLLTIWIIIILSIFKSVKFLLNKIFNRSREKELVFNNSKQNKKNTIMI